MAINSSNYNLLISKLDRFIRKYYINQLIRGLLYTIGLSFGIFLIYSLLESQFFFNMATRKFLFISYVGTVALAFIFWIVFPLIRYFKLGRTISHDQAANIIGTHFSGVQDKLVNVLQLKKQNESGENTALLAASIDQKTAEITPVPFRKAIDLSQNRKYLKYALPPFLLFIVLLFAAPSLIKDSSYRIINNDVHFEKDAPFQFELLNREFEVPQFEDYTVEVKTIGDKLPNEAYIEIDNFQYKLKKVNAYTFQYTLRNLQKDTEFKIVSGRVQSDVSKISILKKPILTDFEIKLDYPAYTGRRDEILENTGDILIPEGTKTTWIFNTENTDLLHLTFNDNKVETIKDQASFTVTKRVVSDQRYSVFVSNSSIPEPDSVQYVINVIKDQYPIISVEQFKDSTTSDLVYFLGNTTDDYGIRKLDFVYKIFNENQVEVIQKSIPIEVSSKKDNQYSYTLDLNEAEIEPGQTISYYFEVFDNDQVNGSKSSKTNIMQFNKPSFEQLKLEEEANEEEIKQKLKESNRDVEKLREKFQKMRENLLQKKEMEWQDKKELEKLIEQQKQMQEKMKEAKEKFDQNMKNQEEFQKPNEDIQKKQEKLEEKFEQLMDPEKQEMLDKIQELIQELDKEDALEMMEQFEMSNEMMQQNMEQLEELFKQLEMEKEVSETIEELQELAKEQEELAEETKEQKKDNEALKEEQEKLNEKFEDIEKKLNELEKKNEELSPPKDLGEDNQEQMDDIQQDMDNAQEELQQQDSKGAAKSQKDAAQKMKNMAGSLQSSMQSGEQAQQMEDIKAIRQILENLVTVSFDQESLFEELKVTSNTVPRYVDLVQDQFKLKDDFKIIEDSLSALAKRNDKIESFVTDKVVEVKYNMNSSIDLLEERSTSRANEAQRKTMTNINDLALMLSESMNEMQQSASAGMPGSQMCNKPGGKNGGKSGKVPMDKITQGQQGMSKKLQEMQGKQGKGGKPSAKDFAEAAAKQAALRKALQDMQKEKMEQGKGSGELQDIIDEMNKNEVDLVNKRLNNEMLKRQQDIVTRLLEAEKSERQREYDDKRKGETGKEIKKELPPAIQEYLKQRQAEVELYKTVSPDLKPYYRHLVDEYYKALKKN